MSKKKNNEEINNEISDDMVCSFCGKSGSMVAGMVEGPDGAAICNECLESCVDVFKDELDIDIANAKHSSGNSSALSEQEIQNLAMLNAMKQMPPYYAAEYPEDQVVYKDDSDKKEPLVLNDLPTPSQIFDALSEYVIGRIDGVACFVKGALVGETVQVKIIKVAKNCM